MLKITQTITTELPDISYFDVYLTENDYTGFEPSFDEEGRQIFDEEGKPVMQEVSKEEYASRLTKSAAMGLVRNATKRKQDKVGSLQYNASEMNTLMEQVINVKTIIEE